MPYRKDNNTAKNNHRYGVVLAAILSLASGWASAQASTLNRVFGHIKLYDIAGKLLENHANVVVFLEGDLVSGEQLGDPAAKISQKGKIFNPRVLPIVKGQQIDFYNDDDVHHNVFSLSRTRPFDLGIYPQGQSKLVEFSQPGLVKLYCNIHPRMMSTILVLDNPFFAITLPDGKFEIDNIPDGVYDLRIWHELSEEQRISIRVTNGQLLEQHVAMRLTKKIVKHKNKFGKRYRIKY